LIALDTNVLVHAHRPESAEHRASLKRLTALCEGEAPWGIPSPCLAEFTRQVTHPSVMVKPCTPMGLRSLFRPILESPSFQLLLPGRRFPELFFDAVEESRGTGRFVFDAQIVAICRENGIRQFVTYDRDFRRFKRFRTEAA